MKQVKYKVKRKVEIKGENVRLISRTSPTTRTYPLNRALIGGAQPNSGWWAPVAALYKEVGGRTHTVRGSPFAAAPTDIPSDLGFSVGRREAPPPPPLPTSPPSPSSHGQGIELLQQGRRYTHLFLPSL